MPQCFLDFGGFMNKVAGEALRAFPPPRSRPDYLYHYTKADALRKIVESKTLWASNAYYLNDMSEVEYGCGIAAAAIDKVLIGKTSSAARQALQHTQSILQDKSQAAIRAQTIFVACFCEEGNLLSQWREYGRPQGFSLAFKTKNLEHMRPPGKSLSLALTKVLYRRGKQKKKIEALVNKAAAVLADRNIAGGDFDRFAAKEVAEKAGEFLSQTLLVLITSLKAPDFAEEREWRLVAQPIYTSFPAQRALSSAGIRAVVKLRLSQCGLVPYIELSPPRHIAMPELLRKVICGPTYNPELAHSAARLLLDSHGFQSVVVDGSKIPVRL